MAVREHLSSRLKTGWEGQNFLEANKGEVIRDKELVVLRQDCIIRWIRSTLQRYLHILFFFLKLFRSLFRHLLKPTSISITLIRPWPPGTEEHLSHSVDLVLRCDQDHGPAGDMVCRLRQGYGLDAERNDVALGEHLWLALLLEGGVRLRDDPVNAFEVISQQLLSVFLLPLLVQLNHCQFLLGKPGCWVLTHESNYEEMFAEQSRDWVVLA